MILGLKAEDLSSGVLLKVRTFEKKYYWNALWVDKKEGVLPSL